MSDRTSLVVAFVACGVASACASRSGAPASGPAAAAASVIPASFVGSFVDDYDNRYTITASEWRQLPRSKHHIVRVDVAGQYIIARNDSTNRTAPNKWMRIDWVALEGMPPYTWGYCYSTWKAESEAEAAAVRVANRGTPRSGCNGYPFTRMKVAPPPAPAR